MGRGWSRVESSRKKWSDCPTWVCKSKYLHFEVSVPLNGKDEQFRSEPILATFFWESANCKRNKYQALKTKATIIVIVIWGHWTLLGFVARSAVLCWKTCLGLLKSMKLSKPELRDGFDLPKMKNENTYWSFSSAHWRLPYPYLRVPS